MKHSWLQIAVPIFLLSGCASSLKVTDSDKTSGLPGVPVSAPLLVEVVTTTTYRGVGDPPEGCDLEVYCAARASAQATFLPLGRTYYVNYDSAQFAKSEFNLKFAESGVLTGVTLNSTPSAESFTGLLEAVLPYLKAPKGALPGAEPPEVAPGVPGCPLTPAQVFEKHCIQTGSRVTSVREIQVESAN